MTHDAQEDQDDALFDGHLDAFTAAPALCAIDAQHVSASVDSLAFDNSLSFLDNLDELSAMLDDNASNLEPDLLVTDSATIQHASTQAVVDLLSLPTDNEHPTVDFSALQVTIDPVTRNSEPIQPTQTSMDPPKPTATATATTSRTRQKLEMDYLRAQVADLERELNQLKSDPSCVRTAVVIEPSPWEKIAQRQSEARQRASIENAQLRELLEGQLKVARSLERLLTKRSLTETTSRFTESKRLCSTHAMDQNTEMEAIRGRIHSQLDQVDAVMMECGLSHVVSDMDDAQATTTTQAARDSAICMEMLVAKTLPFPVEQVAEALWQCTSTGRTEVENGCLWSSLQSESTCNLHFELTVRQRRAEAMIQVHGVGARRVEAHRSLIVFEAVRVTQGTRGTFAVDSPIRCREYGYVVIEAHAGSGCDGTLPSTIVKTCSRLVPESADTTTTDDSNKERLHVGAFIDLGIGSYNQNTKTMLQNVENILLEQSVDSRR